MIQINHVRNPPTISLDIHPSDLHQQNFQDLHVPPPSSTDLPRPRRCSRRPSVRGPSRRASDGSDGLDAPFRKREKRGGDPLPWRIRMYGIYANMTGVYWWQMANHKWHTYGSVMGLVLPHSYWTWPISFLDLPQLKVVIFQFAMSTRGSNSGVPYLVAHPTW